jgi:CDP-glucose 4,6-dehydratase
MKSRRVNPTFWNNKRVLLTGHTGFKGSWLSLWLQSLGAEVRGIALAPPTSPSLFEMAKVSKGMDSHLQDIRFFEKIKLLFDDFKPEILIHMAAQPLVRLSYIQPLETFATNVMGTVNILEAARQTNSIKTIVNITSDKCYENSGLNHSYSESEPMGGHDPYSSSKGCAELVSSAYSRSFMVEQGISMGSARAGNVIGGGDWASDRLIPDILRSIEKGESIYLRNPNSIRPWQHVLEPLSGYLILAEYLYENEPCQSEGWNFGPCSNGERSVSWVVDYLCKTYGCNQKWSKQPGDHPHEAEFLKLDISKARDRLHWEPQWNLETALNRTVEWHKYWLDGEDVRAICFDQIASYQN